MEDKFNAAEGGSLREGKTGCEIDRSQDLVYKAVMITGKTAVGLGIGIAVGIGVVAAAAVAEVLIPAALTFKALGLTGGALGFLHGAKNFK